MTLLSCEALHVVAGNGVPVCAALEWRIEPGSCWGVLGRNGAGKSTLLHTLAGLRPPQAGEIHLQGSPLAQWSRRQVAQRVGVLFQNGEEGFSASVLETVLAGRHPHLSPWRGEREEDRALALAALAAVGMEALAGRGVHTLSGGERRRMEVAALLTQDPLLYLLDEPANHLDPRYQLAMLQQLVARAGARGGAVVMILHDLHLAARFCDHFLLVYGEGETEVVRRLDGARLQRLHQIPFHLADASAAYWVPN